MKLLSKAASNETLLKLAKSLGCNCWISTIRRYREFDEMKKATETFFTNDEFDENAKKEMLDLMSELFWKSKTMNKSKNTYD